MQFCEIIRMRILVGWIGVPLPFVQIGKAVAIGILVESVGILDGQGILFEPIVRDRRMDLCVLQRCRQTVCADEMSFRNKKTGASAGFPLGWVLELLCGTIE